MNHYILTVLLEMLTAILLALDQLESVRSAVLAKLMRVGKLECLSSAKSSEKRSSVECERSLMKQRQKMGPRLGSTVGT